MTDIVGNETLRSVWEDLESTQGDKTFLVFQDCEGLIREYTYQQFSKEINRTANLFIERGIESGETVAVHMRTSPEFMMCLFGLASIGAIMVPMNEQYVQEECEYVLEMCKSQCTVIDEEYQDLYQRIEAKSAQFSKGIVVVHEKRNTSFVNDFNDLKDAQPLELKELRPLHSEDPCEILFTSGTTARAKGVIITHCNMIFSGLYGNWQVSLRSDDRVLSTMPACHSNFQLAAMTPVLTAGATLVVVKKYSVRRFWQQVRTHKATIIQATAMMVRTLMLRPVDPEEKKHQVREVLYFLPIADEEKISFEERFDVRILNTYGSTESLTWVLTDPPVGPRKWPSVGRVGLSYEAKIVDDEKKELGPGEIGEIYVKGVPGRTIMKGYYRDAEETKRIMSADGWLRTGDKGYVDESGWFYFVDRKVNMVKRSGENISTTELENVLIAHPDIAEAAVIGVPDPIRDQAIKAFVRSAQGKSLTEETVLAYCKEHMAPFKVPSYIELVDDFPRTCSMKIEKRLLK